MRFSFLIIDDNAVTIKETLEFFENFPNYFCAGIVKDNQMVINKIIKMKPQLVLMRIPDQFNDSDLSFTIISELFQYVDTMPYFIGLASTPGFALEAIQAGFSDYLLAPLHLHQLGKSLFKFEKRNPIVNIATICLKSYSDYQFLALEDIVYLKADNNTTDFQLQNGKTVSAYKTLKHFEDTLPFYFLRIHKSYIININYVSRIHFSKSKCYLNHNQILPFSLSYKDNIDALVRKINI